MAPADRSCRPSWPGCAAVVLAGGSSRRLGGTDKLAEHVAGRSLLQHVVDRVPAATPLVLVGPPRPVERAPGSAPVRWTREEPPGGGPAAGAAAGLAVLAPSDLVVVLAGDAPRGPLAVPALLAALDEQDAAAAAVATDAAGVRQQLLAVHRRAALEALLASGRSLAGRPARWLLDAHVAPVIPVDVPEVLLGDVDTPGALAALRADPP